MIDGPASSPEPHSHPEGGVQGSDWSQNVSQDPGALSLHRMYDRCVCDIGSMLHPDPNPSQVSKYIDRHNG